MRGRNCFSVLRFIEYIIVWLLSSAYNQREQNGSENIITAQARFLCSACYLDVNWIYNDEMKRINVVLN